MLSSDSSSKQPLRRVALQTARNFRRSWVDMAEVLHKVNERRAFEQWGFSTLQQYATSELGLKSTTVSKLLLSFGAYQKFATEKSRGEAAEIPSMGALQYLDKAIGDEKQAKEVSGEMRDALREAVFDDRQSVAVLKKTFDPVFFPTSEKEAAMKELQSLGRTIRKLDDQLSEAITAEPLGLDEASVGRAQRALASVLMDVERQILANSDDAERKSA